MYGEGRTAAHERVRAALLGQGYSEDEIDDIWHALCKDADLPGDIEHGTAVRVTRAKVARLEAAVVSASSAIEAVLTRLEADLMAFGTGTRVTSR